MDRREALIEAVFDEMERVWGQEGFGGEFEAYDWLLQHYGISEEEDNRWLDILAYDTGELVIEEYGLEEEEEEAMLSFLENDDAVNQFLTVLLQKYRSSSAVYSTTA